MKLEPMGGVGARVTLRGEKDVQRFARILSFARNGQMGGDEREGRETEKMLERLAGMCEALDSDAEVYLEKPGKPYHEARKIFDPGYEVPS